MRFNPINRRHFLQGLGGTTLSLPLLSSLWPRGLSAQAQPVKSDFFIGIDAGGHGGILRKNMIGEKALQMSGPAFTERLYYEGGLESGRIFTDHHYRYAPLSQLMDTSGATPRLSKLIGSEFNPYLSKMTIIDGLAMGCYLGHHRALWGNITDNYNGSDESRLLPGIASVDTIMANSSAVYANLQGVSMPQARIGRVHTGHGPRAHNFNGERLQNNITRPSELMGLFGGGIYNPNNSNQLLLVDRVYDDYARLLSPAGLGNKLSQEDRYKVDAAMQSIFQIEQNINALLNCSDFDNPFANNQHFFDTLDQAKADLIFPLIAEALAQAIYCGLTKVINFNPSSWVSQSCVSNDLCVTNDYHDDIAHKSYKPWENPAQQELHSENRRKHIAAVFRNIVAALDALPVGGGKTLLDIGQVHYHDEIGMAATEESNVGHSQSNLSILTAGSGNGYYETGHYVNYNNFETDHIEGNRSPGLMMNQYWATLLKSMGVPDNEYQNPDLFGGPGYGHYLVETRRNHFGDNTVGRYLNYSQYYIQQKSGEPLPFWVKGAS
jgi:hypothetical protein